MLAKLEKKSYLCIAIEKQWFLIQSKKRTGCSAVRLAHLLWEQGVPGSNPGTPTLKDKELLIIVTPFFYCPKHPFILF